MIALNHRLLLPHNSDPITQTCVPCHSYCKKCFGSGPLKCTECNDTYFYLADGCYLTCPVGLFGNQQDKLCTQCNELRPAHTYP